MSQTIITTMTTLNIDPTESNKATITIFIATLCDMNLRGLSVLNNLNTLMKGSSIF